MRGGAYTQFAVFAGDKWAGYSSVVSVIGNMSLAMYALSFAEYAVTLLPSGGVRDHRPSWDHLFYPHFFGVV